VKSAVILMGLLLYVTCLFPFTDFFFVLYVDVSGSVSFFGPIDLVFCRFPTSG
jgi:hypothetical protein